MKSPPPPQYEMPWRRLAADVAVWAILVLLLVAFRGVLLWVFRAQLSPQSGAESLVRCFRTGLCYDVSVASYAVMPLLLMTLAAFVTQRGSWQTRARMIYEAAALLTFAFVFVIDFAYFAEYQNQFDEWLFGLLYDDRKAILLTIWKTYPIVWLTLGTLAAVALGLAAVRKLHRVLTTRLPVITLVLLQFQVRA